MTLTVGSLFSGIGGLDLGLERAGMKVIWQSEIDPYATRVLNKHWPEVPNHGDIKRIEWSDVVRPDVICGGYPCQPFSLAGARQGEEDPRHLWPWVREAIRVLRPRYAILENVRGHLSLGGSTVLREIAALGYCAEWRIVSAASVGANHRRDRIIIVAYPNRQDEPNASKHEVGMVADTDDARSRASRRDYQREGSTSLKRRNELPQSGPSRRGANVADTDGAGLERNLREIAEARHDRRLTRSGSALADTESRVDVRRERERSDYRGEVFGGDNLRRGTPFDEIWKWWETEPGVGRVANGIPNRVDRLKGLGNAVVPQVAEVIGRLVLQHYETVTA